MFLSHQNLQIELFIITFILVYFQYYNFEDIGNLLSDISFIILNVSCFNIEI